MIKVPVPTMWIWLDRKLVRAPFVSATLLFLASAPGLSAICVDTGLSAVLECLAKIEGQYIQAPRLCESTFYGLGAVSCFSCSCFVVSGVQDSPVPFASCKTRINTHCRIFQISNMILLGNWGPRKS